MILVIRIESSHLSNIDLVHFHENEASADMRNPWWLKVPMVTSESGLQYKDIKVGQGPSPPVGFQVCFSVILEFTDFLSFKKTW